MSTVFACSLCSYSSTRLYNLKRHQQARHVQSENGASENIVPAAQNVMTGAQNVMTGAQNVMTGYNSETSLHQCDMCHKMFRSSYNLKRHLNTCKGSILPNQCHKCQKVLSNRQNKYHHLKTCKAMDQPGTTVHNHIINNHNTMITNNTTTTTNSHNNTVVNVVINSYGNENFAHVTPEYIHKCLMGINGRGVVKCVKDMHFNLDIPENHNIRKHSNKELKIYENSEWITRPLRWSIVELLHKYSTLLKNKMYDQEFKNYVNDFNTWLQIANDHHKFNEKSNPADFWRSVREISDAIENMERHYQRTFAGGAA